MEDRYLFKGKRLDNEEWIFGFLSVHKTGKYFIRPCVGITGYEMNLFLKKMKKIGLYTNKQRKE